MLCFNKTINYILSFVIVTFDAGSSSCHRAARNIGRSQKLQIIVQSLNFPVLQLLRQKAVYFEYYWSSNYRFE